MKSSTTRRLGGALVATLIAVPLTAGVAGAEVTTPPSEASSTSAEQPGDAGPPEGSGPQDADAEAEPATEQTLTEDEQADGSDTEAAPEESGTPDEEPTPTAPARSAAEDEAPPEETDEVADPVMTAIGIQLDQYTTTVSWRPSGVYSTRLTGLSVSGLDADGTLHAHLDATFRYRLNGQPLVDFTPVDGAFEVPGLVVGENTIDVIAWYGDSNTRAVISDMIDLDVTVGTLADLIDDVESDLLLPRSTTRQGEVNRFAAAAGFFGAGESVVVTLVPVAGGSPITLATATAGADGSFTHELTVPTSLDLGSYYLIAEGADSHTVGLHRMTVVAALPAPAAPAAPTAPTDSAVLAAAPTAPTASRNAADRLAATGAEPQTGLLAGGLLTLLGAGAVAGTAGIRRVRASHV